MRSGSITPHRRDVVEALHDDDHHRLVGKRRALPPGRRAEADCEEVGAEQGGQDE